ncbi:MAG: hypothetical protein AB7V32_05235 [Candidatus Berkiella sp.]
MLFPLSKSWYLAYYRKTRYRYILNTLQSLYGNTDPFAIAKHAKSKQKESSELTYGEINSITILDLFARISPRNELVYDLGSGGGKAMLAIKLRYPQLNVIGIEKVPALNNLAKEKYLEYLKRHKLKEADFLLTHIQQDIKDYPFDDAQIIFINATAFEDSWPPILEKLHQVKSGSKIIITSKTLSPDAFKKLYQGMEQMSWGLTSTYIYEKK